MTTAPLGHFGSVLPEHDRGVPIVRRSEFVGDRNPAGSGPWTTIPTGDLAAHVQDPPFGNTSAGQHTCLLEIRGTCV